MLALSFSLLAGAFALALMPQLADRGIYIAVLTFSLALPCLSRWYRLSAFLAGFSIMGVAASGQIDDRLAPHLDGATLALKVRIDDFAEGHAESLRFVARPLGDRRLPSRIRLTWLAPAATPQPGEVWRFEARVRRPHGYTNPGTFDYERWLFRQGVGATGYVLEGSHSYRVHGEAAGYIQRIRSHVLTRIGILLPDDAASAVLLAIAVGARHKIDRGEWDHYAATGTSHLMAISGLHIGLATGISYMLAWLCIAPFCPRRNLRDIAACVAALAALVYAGLSGFGIPSQRATLMVLAALLTMHLRQPLKPGTLLGIPAMLIFISDPIAILSPGFALSFSAVAILFSIAAPIISVSLPGTGVVVSEVLKHGVRLCNMQLALCVGLFPLTVLFFDRFALVAPLINLLVVPIFNVVTVPATLLGSLLDGPFALAGDALLRLARQSIGWLLWLVGHAAEWPYSSYRTALSARTPLLLLPLLYVVLPAGWPGRRLALIAMVAALCSRPAPPPYGCFEYHALDVGQGQAVVIRTHAENFLFDTGPAFVSGSNAGDLIILPFLKAMGIDRLERVIVSHADLDHAGGLVSVLAALDTGFVLAGEPLVATAIEHASCVSGGRWMASGIEFRIVHPRRNSPWTGNNASCVLEISAGGHRLLLTGDIEAPVETLLEYYAQLRRQDVVFVPHHGSRTSSTRALVGATRPRLAIVTAGYRNRWGFPKAEVAQRWQESGARLMNTAVSGAISQQVCRDSGLHPLKEARLTYRRYWHESAKTMP